MPSTALSGPAPQSGLTRAGRGTGPNQLMEVSFKSWLVWSLALDDELLRALNGPDTSKKKKPGRVTEPGFKENPREYAASLDPCRTAKQSLTTKFVPALSKAF
jgi:hypothetical protein